MTARSYILRSSGHLEQGLSKPSAPSSLREARDEVGEARALARVQPALEALARETESLAVGRQAFLAAERARADGIAAGVASRIAYTLALRLHRTEEARTWLDVAIAKLARHGRDDDVEISVRSRSSQIEATLGNVERALEENTRVLEALVRLVGPSSLRTCGELTNRGWFLHDLGRYEEAATTLRDSIACGEAGEGTDSPNLAVDYGNYGQVLESLGRPEEALKAYRHAVDLRKPLGPRDGVAIEVVASIATVEVRRGRFAEAEAAARQVIDGAPAADSDPSVVAIAQFALGLARAGVGDPAGASAACRRAVEIEDEVDAPKPDKPYDLDALACLGDAELALGDVAHAREHLERSVALVRRKRIGELGLARFGLARALLAGDQPGSRERSRWHSRPAPTCELRSPRGRCFVPGSTRSRRGSCEATCADDHGAKPALRRAREQAVAAHEWIERGCHYDVGYPVAVTAAAIGSIVYSLPPACYTVMSGGVAYQQCGSTYDRPQYSGSQLRCHGDLRAGCPIRHYLNVVPIESVTCCEFSSKAGGMPTTCAPRS